MKKRLCFVVMWSCLFLQTTMSSGDGNRDVIHSHELEAISLDITTAIVSEDVSMHYRQASAAQNLISRFLVSSGGSGVDLGYSVKQTADEGYVVVGETSSYGAGSSDVLLLKYDASGALVWAKTAGGSDSDSAFSVQQTADEGYVVAGLTFSYGAGSSDVLLLKYNALGVLAWARTAGGSNYDEGDSVQLTADGGYIITGITRSYGAGDKDVLLLKYNALGALVWARTAGGSNEDAGRSVQQTADRGYVVAGWTYSYGAGSSDVLLLKYDALGALDWAVTAGGTDSDYGYSVQQTGVGGYVVAGWTYSYGAGSSDVLLLKYDALGALDWAVTAGGSNNDSGYSVQQTADGGYVVAGETENNGPSYHDALLLKYDASGMLAWAKTAGGSNYDYGHSVQQTADGEYVVAGLTSSYGPGSSDVLLLKVDADGAINNCPSIAPCILDTTSPVLTTTIPPMETTIPPIATGNPSLSTSAPVLSTTIVCGHVPISTPTLTPTLTPTVTTSFTPDCNQLGVQLFMPSNFFMPGDPCWLAAVMCSNLSVEVPGIPLFVVLAIADSYWFWPSWRQYPGIDYQEFTLEPGTQWLAIIPPFSWPETGGELSGIHFYSAMLDPGFTSLFGSLGMCEFGYGSPSTATPTGSPISPPTVTGTPLPTGTPALESPTPTAGPAMSVTVEPDQGCDYTCTNSQPSLANFCFGSEFPGDCTSYYAVCTVANTGGSTLEVSCDLTGDNPDDFQAESPPGMNFSIAPGYTVTISMRFCPGDTGVRRAILSIHGAGSVVELCLEGFATY